MSTHPVHQLLERGGPRKILAIDGGGIRGIIALGAIAEIERVLRRVSGNNDLVLADYFDFFAGTSTGAVIAAGLCAGMPAAALEDLYVNHAWRIFIKAGPLMRHWRHIYRDGPLRQILQDLLGDMTLGSPRLRALLLLVLRNATTDSPWLLTNNPAGKYNQSDLDDCNLNLPLWQLVRASAAAPSFFPPERVVLGNRNKVTMTFEDGATTPYNNPGFQAFLIATLDRYRIQWPAGEDRMLLISVGTGNGPLVRIDRKAHDMSFLDIARSLPQVQIGGNSVEQDMLCRVFGSCVEGEEIDSEIGDLIRCSGTSAKLFTYARYNVTLTNKAFQSYGIAQIDPASLKLDAYRRTEELKTVGRVMAQRVKPEHFASFPAFGIAPENWRRRAIESPANG